MNHLYLEEFERKIEYTFLNKHLLRLALTHSSYANEIKRGGHENNERLEFLGDAVLDMVVSEYMYRQFPQMPEGELTKLRAAVVCGACQEAGHWALYSFGKRRGKHRRQEQRFDFGRCV